MFDGTPIDLGEVKRNGDGSVNLNAAPMRAGDYEYLAFELPPHPTREFNFYDRVTGRITVAETERVLEQFEGLPITDDHVWVENGERSQTHGGTILQNGVMDGELVRTRANIFDPKLILKVASGDDQELSIGFYNRIRWNENTGDDEPDFFIEDIDLNHVAVVKEGRAGPDARLSHHKAQLEDSEMKKITINGVEFEVSDEIATAYAAQQKADADKLTAMENSLAAVTTERDTAVGRVAASTSALENAKANAKAEAVKVATDHAAFVGEAQLMGHDPKDLVIGQYDSVQVRRDILKNSGVTLPDDSSDDVVLGAWLHAIASVDETGAGNSVFNNSVPPKSTESSATGPDGSRETSMLAGAHDNLTAAFHGRKAKTPKTED